MNTQLVVGLIVVVCVCVGSCSTTRKYCVHDGARVLEYGAGSFKPRPLEVVIYPVISVHAEPSTDILDLDVGQVTVEVPSMVSQLVHEIRANVVPQYWCRMPYSGVGAQGGSLVVAAGPAEQSLVDSYVRRWKQRHGVLNAK
jgi:hypothetical protein